MVRAIFSCFGGCSAWEFGSLVLLARGCYCFLWLSLFASRCSYSVGGLFLHIPELVVLLLLVEHVRRSVSPTVYSVWYDILCVTQVILVY